MMPCMFITILNQIDVNIIIAFTASSQKLCGLVLEQSFLAIVMTYMNIYYKYGTEV